MRIGARSRPVEPIVDAHGQGDEGRGRKGLARGQGTFGETVEVLGAEHEERHGGKRHEHHHGEHGGVGQKRQIRADGRADQAAGDACDNEALHHVTEQRIAYGGHQRAQGAGELVGGDGGMGRQSGEEVGGQGDEPSPAGDGVHETGDERQRAHDEKLHDAFPSRLSATLAGRKKSRPRAAREFLVAPTGFEPATSALRGRRPKPLDDGATWRFMKPGGVRPPDPDSLVAPTGFEPATSALRGRRPKPLDDGATKCHARKWLGWKESNPHIRHQKPLSCH